MEIKSFLTRCILLGLLPLLFFQCDRTGLHDSESGAPPLFTLLDSSVSGIDFNNQLEHTEAFNAYTYRNFYNGAGVAIGDINNDGLSDVYFSGNQVNNKLYLNKGNLQFEDITAQAGVACADVWSTGVTMVDINADGWLDLYVCKSGPPEGKNRRNELFINNGDLTFTEQAAQFGLDDLGLTNHAAFFDYDNDGDLDCYLLNNSMRSIGVYDLKEGQREIRDPQGGNKLYQNRDGHFIDVSEEAGIYGSAIGFGLGVTVSDINRDGWADIYVSNDFFERDYLYINQQNGTFSEQLPELINEISLSSMGADIADINNDGFPEIFVTDMLPEIETRIKTKTQFETWDKYQLNVQNGYHHQFTRNTLQLNNGDQSFSEIGRMLDMDATDWSWGAIMADFNNDGKNDIFVANGLYKDLTDQDYINFFADPSTVISLYKKDSMVLKKLIDAIPSTPIKNYLFINKGDLTFENQNSVAGLDLPSFSNGAAYGDLDNDGDLDLIVNNVNSQAFVYQNNSNLLGNNHFIQLLLAGEKENINSIGAQISLYIDNQLIYWEHNPMKGYLSTMDHKVNLGIGNAYKVDSLIIKWPSHKITKLINPAIDQQLVLNEKDAIPIELKKSSELPDPVFANFQSDGFPYSHQENVFADFNRDRLLYHMLSTEGPNIAVGDINNDQLEDIFIGGAKGKPGAILIQQSNGTYKTSNEYLLLEDSGAEDMDALFFDADNDNDLDLYVASGGSEFATQSDALIDRLYFNDGNGKFTRSEQDLPTGKQESTGTVKALDFDQDGDSDLLVGVRLTPFLYGVPGNAYLLENNGKGKFTDVTNQLAPEMLNLGMFTDALVFDYDQDEDVDIVFVGDWMGIELFENDDGVFVRKSAEAGLNNSNGFWNTIEAGDFNEDGKMDFVAGNHGLNSRFKASPSQPVKMYVNDFDQNGSAEQIICLYNEGTSYPLVLRTDLITQLPGLKKKYLKFENYRNQTITDMFEPEVLQKSVALEAHCLESSVFINNGNSFTRTSLPKLAQFSPTYAIAVDDFDGDHHLDILLGGNLSKAKPEVGSYNASYGLLLTGNGKGDFIPQNSKFSGIKIDGEIRDLKITTINKTKAVIAARNNDNVKIFTFE